MPARTWKDGPRMRSLRWSTTAIPSTGRPRRALCGAGTRGCRRNARTPSRTSWATTPRTRRRSRTAKSGPSKWHACCESGWKRTTRSVPARRVAVPAGRTGGSIRRGRVQALREPVLSTCRQDGRTAWRGRETWRRRASSRNAGMFSGLHARTGRRHGCVGQANPRISLTMDARPWFGAGPHKRGGAVARSGDTHGCSDRGAWIRIDEALRRFPLA